MKIFCLNLSGFVVEDETTMAQACSGSALLMVVFSEFEVKLC